MKGDLYTGTIKYNNEESTVSMFLRPILDRSINIVPFEVSSSSDVAIDLLYYNRVNEVGDVLRSLVAIGNPRPLTDRSLFTYNPDTLFRGTLAELNVNVTNSDVSFPGYNYVVQRPTLPLYYEDPNYTQLDSNGKLANTLGPLSVAFDGWYSFVSVGVFERTTQANYGSISFTLNGSDIEIAQTWIDNPSDSYWIPIEEFDNPVLDMSGFLDINGITNSYIGFDFFVSYDFKKLYNKTLKDLEETPKTIDNNSVLVIGDSMRDSLSNKDFRSSQLLLQSVEDLILINGI